MATIPLSSVRRPDMKITHGPSQGPGARRLEPTGAAIRPWNADSLELSVPLGDSNRQKNLTGNLTNPAEASRSAV